MYGRRTRYTESSNLVRIKILFQLVTLWKITNEKLLQRSQSTLEEIEELKESNVNAETLKLTRKIEFLKEF